MKKHFKTFFILTGMILLLFGFNTTKTFAQAPKEAVKGKLPIPGTNNFSDDLTLQQTGTILKNGETTLVWTDKGDLKIMYYDKHEIWSSQTSGRIRSDAAFLCFHDDGRLIIKDGKGVEIWSFPFVNSDAVGDKLKLMANRNLELQSSTGEKKAESKTAMPVLEKDKMNTVTHLGSFGQDFMVPYNIDKGYVTIHAEGADGGKRVVNETWGATRFTVNGGSGATIKATFEIGTGDNQIPPGSVLRVITGQKGPTQTTQLARGAAGGGGTGVLFKRPAYKNGLC